MDGLEHLVIVGRGNLERLPEALTAMTMFFGSGIVSTRYWIAPRVRQVASAGIVAVGTGACLILSRDPSKWTIYLVTGLFTLALSLSGTSIYKPKK